MNHWTALTLLFVLSAVSPVFAHGTESALMGTVTAVTATRITVRAVDGDVVVVSVDEATELHKGDAAAELGEVAVGNRVVIDLREEDPTRARSIRLPSAVPADAGTASDHRGHTTHHAGQQ